MLPDQERGSTGPLVIMLHWLGGSGTTWTEVIDSCATLGLTCLALDLPGFGGSSGPGDFRIVATTNSIIASIQNIRAQMSGPWLLVGHSMGGKFAAIVARAALDGTPGLDELCGLILISPSPPGPEPMAETVRRQNIEDLGRSTLDAEQDRAHAEKFIDANTGKLPLAVTVRTRSVDDLLRADRKALVNWFSTGSREDWSAQVGVLALPALILAGTAESALGPSAQREQTLPHLSKATLVALEGAGHLSPLERSHEISDRILAFVHELGFSPLRPGAGLAPAARALVDSPRTSPQTRAVLNQRVADDHLAGPYILTPAELLTLRAVARRIIPGCPFDLAERIHRWLALRFHDGWRHDSLPRDTEAWRIGFHSLDAAALRHHGVTFSALDAGRQDSLLLQSRDGKLGRGTLAALHLSGGPALYSAEQMSEWFADLHAELTRIYVADPRTMHRIGFTGFADEAGFTRIRLNEREEFES